MPESEPGANDALFHVQHEDGDQEDLEAYEVKEALVAEDDETENMKSASASSAVSSNQWKMRSV